ncbi:MAG: ATP-binding protein [Pseudomonadota bacterium]
MLTRIGSKIALAMAITVLAAVVTISAVSVWREATRYVDTRTSEIVGIAKVLASTSADALADNNQIAAQRTLRSIRDFAGVVHATLEDRDGRIFADIGSAVVLERDIEASNQRDPIAVLLGRPLTIAVPVRHESEVIGSLILTSETRDVWPRIAAALVDLLIAGLVTIAIAFLAAAIITRKLVAPLNALRKAMIQLREEQNFAVRVPRQSSDEIGDLTETFNDLLSIIRKRDQAINAHQAGLERTVERRTQDLLEAKTEAERANRAKSTFLATMSHEIRTPMNGMLVLAELLANASLPQREKRYADVINKSGKTLLSIINDILDFSKVEAGQLTLEPIECSPRNILTDVLDVFHSKAQEKGLSLAGHVDNAIPEAIVTDPVRTRQILSNLVGNAIKFTQDGHVRVTINRIGKSGHMHITVADTGIGIPEDKLDTVFDAFSQADQSVTRRYGGTGLGLSICQQLAEAMGGTISVQSREGVGSEFSVTLPIRSANDSPDWATRTELDLEGVCAAVDVQDHVLRWALERHLRDVGVTLGNSNRVFDDAGYIDQLVITDRQPGSYRNRKARVIRVVSQSDAEDANFADLETVLFAPIDHARVIIAVETAFGLSKTEDGQETRDQSHPQWHGASILVADDGAINREVAQQVLGRFGVSVTQASGGNEAVTLAGRTSFDAILMDCNMPDLDGYEATRRIRMADSEAGRSSKIIALTADAQLGENQAWSKHGFDGFVQKPFGLGEIEALLFDLLGPASVTTSTVSQELDIPSEPAQFDHSPGDEDILDHAVIHSLMDFSSGSGEEPLIIRLLALFEEHAPPLIARIQNAHAQQEFGEMASASHALKSMAGNIGAKKLMDLCQEIEANAARKTAVLALVIGELSALYDRSVDYLKIHTIDKTKASKQFTRVKTQSAY